MPTTLPVFPYCSTWTRGGFVAALVAVLAVRSSSTLRGVVRPVLPSSFLLLLVVVDYSSSSVPSVSVSV